MSTAYLYTLIATAITALIVGAWLVLVMATAAMARSQRYLLRKLQYWQDEATHARTRAERAGSSPDGDGAS